MSVDLPEHFLAININRTEFMDAIGIVLLRVEISKVLDGIENPALGFVTQCLNAGRNQNLPTNQIAPQAVIGIANGLTPGIFIGLVYRYRGESSPA